MVYKSLKYPIGRIIRLPTDSGAYPRDSPNAASLREQPRRVVMPIIPTQCVSEYGHPIYKGI